MSPIVAGDRVAVRPYPPETDDVMVLGVVEFASADGRWLRVRTSDSVIACAPRAVVPFDLEQTMEAR